MLRVPGHDFLGGPSAPPFPRLRPVLPLEVLDDPPRVVDDLVAVDEHRHAPLAGQLFDLRPAGTAGGEALRSGLQAQSVKAPGDRPPPAEHGCGGWAAVQGRLGPTHPPALAPAPNTP